MAFKRIVLFAALVLFFLPNVFSQEVFVNLNPVSHSIPVNVYESEPVQFDLVAFNNEGFEVKNFNAKVFVGPALSIIVGGAETKEQLFSFLSLPPKSSAKKSFVVLGKSPSNSGIEFFVKYGVGENLANNYSAFLRVNKSPLAVNARVKKNFFSPLEENGLLVDLKNNSAFELKNLSAELFVPQGLENNSSALFFESFAPGQAVLNSVFAFASTGETIGGKNILLSIKFEDGLGEHFVEKNFSVQVGEKNDFAIIFAAVLAAVALFFYFNKSKGNSAQSNASFKEKPSSH